MLTTNISHADYKTEQLQGGTVGEVLLISGQAESYEGKQPFKVVLKIQKKWERYADPDSWRREYDLYASNLGEYFLDNLRWPKCYHMEITDDETQLWLEYIKGITGLDMTTEMYVRAAEELGRFHGRLYALQPPEIINIKNLSGLDAMEKFYRHYKSWNVVHDYVRSEKCEIPAHLTKMITDTDESANEIFRKIETLPIVLCHRDFWVTNIICSEKTDEACHLPLIALIDWDTTGWGYLGEDLASLIADEADVEHMLEYYKRCVPAYYKGFSEYADIPGLHKQAVCPANGQPYTPNLYIRERIILHFGYRLIEWYLYAETPENKQLHLDTLQKIYEMETINDQ